MVGVTTVESVQESVTVLAEDGPRILARQARIAAPLLSDGRRIIEGSYAGAFAAGPGPGAGLFGRLTRGAVSLLGGLGYSRDGAGRARQRATVTLAAALRYIHDAGGPVHPYAEVGGWLVPDANLTLTRHYMNGGGTATGSGDAKGEIAYYYLRGGIAVILGTDNELALSGEIGRSRLDTAGYVEPLSATNPFEATVAPRAERMTLLRLRGQYTHRLAPKLQATIWANGVWARPGDESSGVVAAVPGIGILAARAGDRSWAEAGGRIDYALSSRLNVELFATGDTGEEGIGRGVQAGIALRTRF